MVVYLRTDTEEYGALAEEIAADRGDPLVGSLESVGADEEVICVTSPEEMSVDLLVRLQKRLVAGGPESGRFGIITGLTPESARDLYYREPDSDSVHGVLATTEFDDRESWDDDTVVHTRYDATRDALAELNREGLESLSGDFSSKSIHTFLGSGLICGVPTNHEITDFDPPYPPCVEGGEMDCPLDAEIIHADHLDVAHVFLGSCLPSLVPRIRREVPVHVGLSLLENASTLIAAYRQIGIDPTQPLLHANLLKTGYDAGERCYLLLEQAHAIGLSWLPFVLFGTPDCAVVDPEPGTFDARVEEGRDSIAVVLSDVETNVVDVTVPADPLADADQLLVKNRTDAFGDEELHYLCFREEDHVRLLVHSWGTLRADSLEVEVLGRNEERAEYERLLSSLENVQALKNYGFGGGGLKNQIDNLRNHLLGFGTRFWDHRFEANAFRETREQLEEIRDHNDKIPETLEEVLLDRHYSSLIREYQENIVSAEMWDSDTSSYCCGYRLFKRKFELYPGGDHRLRAICPGCYCIHDVPVSEDGTYTYPEIHGDLVFERDATKEVTVRFENPLDVTMDARCFMWLSSVSDEIHGADVFHPAHRTTTLAPGETWTATFDVEPPSLLPQDTTVENSNFDNDYTFHGYVVGNNEIYAGSRKVAPLYP